MTSHAVVLFVLCVLIETVEQLLFRTAGRRPERYFACVIPAVVLHVTGLGCWLLLLKHIPLGVALPLMGVNYVSIALAGRYLFGEPVDARRWTGIALILSGFVLVASYQS
jgi:multidrug transporter EmrE-like cation transporter